MAYNLPLKRSRRRWEENIKMNLKEIGVNTKNWVDLTQSRVYWRVLVNQGFNLWVA